MLPPDVHDGERVKARCKYLHLSTADFSVQMHWEVRKTNRMFKRRDWAAIDLSKAGKVLGADFLSVYGKAIESSDSVVVGLIVKPEALQSEAGRLRALEELKRKENGNERKENAD